jgi:hypothetical protein
MNGMNTVVRQLKMASSEEGDIVLEDSGKCEQHYEFLML